MNAPRHLWSGDWRRESAESAKWLAELRHPADAAAEPAYEAPARGPSAVERVLALRRNIRLRGRLLRTSRARPAVLLAVAMLLSAGAAYAVVASLRGHGDHQSALRSPAVGQRSSRGSASPPWLGADTTSFIPTDGAMIVTVTPGGPADRAGLQPGDVITQIDNQPVQSPADLALVLSRLQAGQQVPIEFQRGPGTYTTQATLATRPGGP